jgi:hypothetical protein
MNEENNGSRLIKANYILAIILCIPLVSFVNYLFGALDIAVIIISIIILNKKTYIPKGGTALMIAASIINLIGLVIFYVSLPPFINKVMNSVQHDMHGQNIVMANNNIIFTLGMISFLVRIAAIIVYSMYRKPANK